MKCQCATSLPLREQGFTLIEVMVAILILGFGLLGFALLQTTSVRMSQGANYRTQAANLSAEILDQMRLNRLRAADYPAAATFTAGSRTSTACEPSTETQSVAAMSELWKCQVVRALGDGAGATVTYNNGVTSVSITWGEAGLGSRDYQVVTRL